MKNPLTGEWMPAMSYVDVNEMYECMKAEKTFPVYVRDLMDFSSKFEALSAQQVTTAQLPLFSMLLGNQGEQIKKVAEARTRTRRLDKSGVVAITNITVPSAE
jgi:hypothetical protein